MSTIRPTTRLEGQIWNAMNTGEHFYKIIEWPDRLIAIALKPHKNHQDRLNFMLFLIGNGMDPTMALTWVVYKGEYDAAAWRQLNHIKDNSTSYLNRYAYWDIYLHEYVNR